MDSLKEQLKEQILDDPEAIAANRVKKQINEGVTVSDDEIKDYYEANKSQYVTKPGANVAHILVATEQEAKDVKARLKKGEKFEDVAKAVSTDPGSKDNGGSYGFVEYDSTTYVKEFMDGVKSLKEGEISDPVKTQFGYHIIKATGVVKEEKTTPIEEVKDQIKGTLLKNKQQSAYNDKIKELTDQYKVKKYPDRVDKNLVLK